MKTIPDTDTESEAVRLHLLRLQLCCDAKRDAWLCLMLNQKPQRVTVRDGDVLVLVHAK